MRIQKGSFPLFRLFGVQVYLHWTWVLVALFEISNSKNAPDAFGQHSLAYHIAVYLSLFLIVLIHEFGHALACKSVGGQADRIILWPLGGLAFVRPPQRPGATLWSIAAGPLVNVVLLPLTLGPAFLTSALGSGDAVGDFLWMVAIINITLLVFNMLPVYPLDGGQILRSLIWYVAGRGMSLVIAASIGLAGSVGLAVFVLFEGGLWLGIIAAFMGLQSYIGIKSGLMMMRMDSSPRHTDAHCPQCGQSPPAAAIWICPCGNKFDTFVTGARCSRCGRDFQTTSCPSCGVLTPMQQWYPPGSQPLVPAPAPMPVADSTSSPYFP